MGYVKGHGSLLAGGVSGQILKLLGSISETSDLWVGLRFSENSGAM